MIIPVRCFTCGHVIADKWNYYVKRCKELEKEQESQQRDDEQNDKKLNSQHFDKTVRQKVFEELGLERICCRRMLLGHVDMIDTI
jgi:DNA-directed RNA polymerase subunit N (RpoN/RPB10)